MKTFNLLFALLIISSFCKSQTFDIGGSVMYDSKHSVMDSIVTYRESAKAEPRNRYFVYAYIKIPNGKYYYEGMIPLGNGSSLYRKTIFFNREIVFEYMETRKRGYPNYSDSYINNSLIDKLNWSAKK